MWHYQELGSGRPLILLHGIGLSHVVWAPVMPLLARERRVIAFDLAGFGATPPLPDGIAPTLPNLVSALAGALAELGITEPVDMVGNSLGGLLALEAAKRGLARSVVALSPAGLWRTRFHPVAKTLFDGLQYGTRRFPRAARILARIPWLREMVFMVPISCGSRRMPLSDALQVMDDIARAIAFDATFLNMPRFTGGQSITVPVTIAFGQRDWLLTRSMRRRDELPLHARWVSPAGWGHVPTWVDPAGVARLILEGTA